MATTVVGGEGVRFHVEAGCLPPGTALAVALLSSLALVGTVSAAPPSYTTDVTLDCDGGTPVEVTGQFWKDDPAKRNLRPLGLTSGELEWTLACPDGETGSVSRSLVTKSAPVSVRIFWWRADAFGTVCQAAITWPIPVDTTFADTTDCGSPYARITVASAVRN